MQFSKRKLVDVEFGYSVSTLKLLGEDRVIAASEAKGPAYVFEGPGLEPRLVSSEPGGSMGFAPVPGHDDAFFMITGFYPIFKAEAAGVDLVRAVNRFAVPWDNRRIIELPFVHRIAAADTPAGSFLIASTVCGGKAVQDDWSKPGEVYVYPISDSLDGPWTPQTVLSGIHKNHGLTIGMVDGAKTLLASGTEGLFAIALPGTRGRDGRAYEPWAVRTILGHEVSEMCLFDLDGDGVDELIVIEPFHGNQLAVYRRSGEAADAWSKVVTDELAFGHGLTVGPVNGVPTIVVGNRAGSMDLVCYPIRKDDPWRPERVVIDAGAASAGTTIVETAAGTGIVTSNPARNEYAIYTAARSAS